MGEYRARAFKDLKSSYFFLDNRLRTFKNWSVKRGVCTPEKMAEAGFIMQTTDGAKCFFCYKELDGWEPHDEPMVEHESHSPECPFVKYKKNTTGEMTLGDAINLIFDSMLYQRKVAIMKNWSVVKKNNFD